MKIIIEIKESATLERIAEFGRALEIIQRTRHQTADYLRIDGYNDVIADIHKEG